MRDAWSSIPGETPIDLSDIKDPNIRTRGELNIREAENIRKAVVKYLSQRPNRRTAPFNHPWLKRLHKEMFGDVMKSAGRFRREDLNIGVHWTLINEGLQSLLDDLECWGKGGMVILERATRLHHRAVTIHPFCNGNGRWSRMLANILLKQNDCSTTEWPEPEIGVSASEVRNQYLAALQSADEGDFDPLIALHRQFTPMPSRPIVAQPIPSPTSRRAAPRTWTTRTPPDDK